MHSHVSLIPRSSPKNSVSMFLQLVREANIWVVSSVDLGGHICQNLKTPCRKCLTRLHQSQLLLVQLARWWNSPSFTYAFANTSSNRCQKPLPFNSRERSRRTTGNLFFPLCYCTSWCFIFPLYLTHPWDHVSCLKGVLIASTLPVRSMLSRARQLAIVSSSYSGNCPSPPCWHCGHGTWVCTSFAWFAFILQLPTERHGSPLARAYIR